MRLATVITAVRDAKGGPATRAAVQSGDRFVLLAAQDLSELLGSAGWREEAAAAVAAAETAGGIPGDSIPVDAARFGTVLPRPSKVICCGLNYADHIAEMGRELPEYPTLFAKYADTLIGDGDVIDAAGHGARLDWEAELAVVVGAQLKNASPEEASAAIAGYTVANDISMRDWQSRTLQWFQGKAFDRTTPLGPVLVTPDECDPEAGVRVRCLVNGEEVQNGSTKTLVFTAAALLSYISTFTRLSPGDVVLTGTPGGVGMGAIPPRFLRDGDVVSTEVEGIGTLTNTVRL
ncbi:acylpyruvate hydrolase [Arthrobacter sp. ov407]|uniref:fumarylacetoacetate hydrolase family protein n=1 Tax=Arthrobacter sp. ov407 TaxID=1761748 RepID=UPI00087E88C8|nr:fumarylacetoacetate hydrolase family protein [Arthrobacter sp. ov407]SDL14091.1 acylpyruvate hydrolase [Arthrobacter sp. ov407]